MGKKTLTYTEAYSKLEAILALLEENKLDVDELSEKLKEASGLLQICKDKLFVANEETKKILEDL
ncbi:MAG: exodeoxyribonuclease VII small subunit [Dysgonamonadaceae bacterium]|jgi:exodeoxyribonuclease VII small subunit|nr:exodeoxyribonuclease VII small subunit [Dysgonamonadaceae bacterium]